MTFVKGEGVHEGPENPMDFDGSKFGPRMVFDGRSIRSGEKTRGIVSPGDSGRPEENKNVVRREPIFDHSERNIVIKAMDPRR